MPLAPRAPSRQRDRSSLVTLPFTAFAFFAFRFSMLPILALAFGFGFGFRFGFGFGLGLDDFVALLCSDDTNDGLIHLAVA